MNVKSNYKSDITWVWVYTRKCVNLLQQTGLVTCCTVIWMYSCLACNLTLRRRLCHSQYLPNYSSHFPLRRNSSLYASLSVCTPTSFSPCLSLYLFLSFYISVSIFTSVYFFPLSHSQTVRLFLYLYYCLSDSTTISIPLPVFLSHGSLGTVTSTTNEFFSYLQQHNVFRRNLSEQMKCLYILSLSRSSDNL